MSRITASPNPMSSHSIGNYFILEAFHELGKDAECESLYIQHIFWFSWMKDLIFPRLGMSKLIIMKLTDS